MKKASTKSQDLAALRLQKGISLVDIAESTKISVRYLEAIECGEFARLPGGIYSASYIRQYARAALGILVFDSERWVRLRFYYCAISDAWHGVFDNERPKKLTAVR
jgi:cytoskeletal protein RodZ